VGDCLLSSVGALCFTMVFRVSKLLWPSLVGFFGYFLGVFLVTFFGYFLGVFLVTFFGYFLGVFLTTF
jgi:hypothetical protein